MEGRNIIQYIIDDIRKHERNHYIVRVDNRPGIQIDQEDVDKLQKLLNIADFVEQITKDVMKQFLFNLGKENLRNM